MAILGLMTKGEVQKHIDEALKKASRKKPQYPGWALETADSQRHVIPDLSIYGNQADLYRRLSWVLTAIDLIAQGATTSAFQVKERKGEKLANIENHPFELLLQKPNPVDSRHELLSGTVAMWKLTGNGYWWLNKAHEKAPPDEIWTIPSHMVYPVPDGNMYIKGYVYLVEDGREVWLEPWEIVHFRRFNPFNRFLGLSAIESLAIVATGDIGMQDWNTKLFKENNARLPGIIAFEQYIEDTDWEQIKAETRDKAAKRDMMMLRGVGQGGVKWMQSGVSQKDMEFLAGRQFNKEEIFSVLAPGAASILAINATEANAKTGRATLMEYGVFPMMVVMQEKITSKILSCYDGDLIGEFDDPRVTDRQQELEEIKVYAETHTVAEIREKYYEDEKLGDDRDDKFVVEITPVAVPFGQDPDQPDKPGQPKADAKGTDKKEKKDPAEEKEEKEVNVKALVELDTWERKCSKAGKLVTWHPVALPDDIHRHIQDAGRFEIGLFSQARDAIKAGDLSDYFKEVVIAYPGGEVSSRGTGLDDVLFKLDEAIDAYKAGYRDDQTRGDDGKWVDEGGVDRGFLPGGKDHKKKVGSGTIIGQVDGKDLFEVNRFTNAGELSDGDLAICIRGKNKGQVLYARGGVDAHGRMIDRVSGHLDDYVRGDWGTQFGGVLRFNASYAGSLDKYKGIDNIYEAMDILFGKGFGSKTKVLIIKNLYPSGDDIHTSIKAGYRDNQTRGDDGKWVSEGKGMSSGYTQTVSVSQTDWNNLEKALAMDSPQAEAMLKRVGMTRAEAQAAIKDAESQLQTFEHTKDIHMVDGAYTDERQALHDRIIEDMLKDGVTQENPNVLMSGGLPGAGKSSVLGSDLYAGRLDDYIRLDSDEIKKLLSQADGIKKLTIEAASYHEEADDVLARIFEKAMESKFNVVYDTTMKSADKLVKLTGLFKSFGYSVEVAYVDVHPLTAMTRAIGRYLGGGRYVSIPYIATHDHKNASTARMLKDFSDVWRFWSNEVPFGSKPILVEEK